MYWIGKGLGAHSGGSLFRVSETGGPVKALDSGPSGDRGLSLTTTDIVYVAGEELRIVPKTGDGARTVRSVKTLTGYFYARGLSSDANDVWIAQNLTPSQLLRVSRTTGETKVEHAHSGGGWIFDVVVDADGVYEFHGGIGPTRLYALPK